MVLIKFWALVCGRLPAPSLISDKRALVKRGMQVFLSMRRFMVLLDGDLENSLALHAKPSCTVHVHVMQSAQVLKAICPTVSHASLISSNKCMREPSW